MISVYLLLDCTYGPCPLLWVSLWLQRFLLFWPFAFLPFQWF